MLKRTMYYIFLTILLSIPSFSQELIIDSFYVPSLRSQKHIAIQLPVSETGLKRYPVVYLLHGYGGNHLQFSRHCKTDDLAKEHNVIIVMPEADSSWYINSNTNSKSQYENYIVSDLPRFCATKYSIDTNKQIIAGISMGGYGAVILGLRHPDKFLFAGSLSGALGIPGDIQKIASNRITKIISSSLTKAFGNDPSYYQLYDPVVLLREHGKSPLPYIFLLIGSHDDFPTFLPGNRQFADSLRSYNAAYEYHEVPGTHNWELWNRSIKTLFQRIEEIVNQ